jgi:hypothetical protein
VSVLTELSELVYLDISDDKEESQLYDILTPGSRFKVSALLQRPLSLPKLHSFDISGESPAVNSRIQIRHLFSNCGSGSRVLMTKNSNKSKRNNSWIAYP